MLKIIAAGKRKTVVSFPFFYRNTVVSNLLFLLLFAGILLGCLFSVYTQFQISAPDSFFTVICSAESGFLSEIISAGKYFFLALISATSYLGIFLLPSLIFVRGCALGSAVAYCYASDGFAGLWDALVLCGVTELLTLPVMVLLAELCCFRSYTLLQLRLGKRVIQDQSQRPQRILIFILISISLSIVYRCAVMPLIQI